MTGDASLARQVVTDYRKSAIPQRTKALLDFCVQVSGDPKAVRQGDIDRLRALGWSDQAIHDAVQVTGFFSYYVRLADALGIEPEDFMRRYEPEWGR